MAPVIGIDFGSSFSVVAVFDGNAGVDVISNDIGSRTTPSVVSILDTERLVGAAAECQATMHPHHTIRGVKQLLGTSFKALPPSREGPPVVRDDWRDAPRYLLQPSAAGAAGDQTARKVAPEEVAAVLLSSLKAYAEAEQAVAKVVIAVPTYFTFAQRQATVGAGRIAGFDEVDLVNDTSAAALYYAWDRDCDQTVVVVDVGGGGGSVSVVKTSASGSVTVLASSGERLPGGSDFDSKMMEFFSQDIARRLHVTLSKDERRAYEILRSHWEKAKRKLSRLPQASVHVFLPGVCQDEDYHIDIRREHFEEQCILEMRNIVAAVELVLYKAKVQKEEIDDIILMGASSRIPKLRSLIQDLFDGKELCRAVNPDEAVACGAALYAAAEASIVRARLNDVSPLGLFLKSTNKCNFLEPNYRLPVRVDLNFPWSKLNPKKIMFTVEQGMCEEQSCIMLSVKISSIEVLLEQMFFTVRVDKNGIFTVEHDIPGVNFRKHMEYCLLSKEVAILRTAAEDVRSAERRENERMEAKNALENVCREILAKRAWDRVETGDETLLESNIILFANTLLEWLQSHQKVDMEDYVRRQHEIENHCSTLLEMQFHRKKKEEEFRRELERKKQEELERENERKRREEQEREQERKRQEELEREKKRKRQEELEREKKRKWQEELEKENERKRQEEQEKEQERKRQEELEREKESKRKEQNLKRREAERQIQETKLRRRKQEDLSERDDAEAKRKRTDMVQPKAEEVEGNTLVEAPECSQIESRSALSQPQQDFSNHSVQHADRSKVAEAESLDHGNSHKVLNSSYRQAVTNGDDDVYRGVQCSGNSSTCNVNHVDCSNVVLRFPSARNRKNVASAVSTQTRENDVGRGRGGRSGRKDERTMTSSSPAFRSWHETEFKPGGEGSHNPYQWQTRRERVACPPESQKPSGSFYKDANRGSHSNRGRRGARRQDNSSDLPWRNAPGSDARRPNPPQSHSRASRHPQPAPSASTQPEPEARRPSTPPPRELPDELSGYSERLQAVLASTMKEVRDAGMMSLLLATLPGPRDPRYVAMTVRYCKSSGAIAEVLLALVEVKNSGLLLFRRFTALCEWQNVDWREGLLGVSTDASWQAQTTYNSFFVSLQREIPRLRWLWDSTHSLGEHIALMGRSHHAGGKKFFESLDVIRRLFKTPSCRTLLAKECREREENLRLESYEDITMFIARHLEPFTAVIESLASTRQHGKSAKEVHASLSSDEFISCCFVLSDVFRKTSFLIPSKECALNVDIELNKLFSVPETYISKVIAQVGLESKLPQARRTSNWLKNMLEIFNTAVKTVESRVVMSSKPIRDMHMLNSISYSSQRVEQQDKLFDWIPGMDKKKLAEDISNLRALLNINRNQTLTASDAVVRIMKSWKRNEFKRKYSSLYRGLLTLCTMPLLSCEGEDRLYDKLCVRLQNEELRSRRMDILQEELIPYSAAELRSS